MWSEEAEETGKEQVRGRRGMREGRRKKMEVPLVAALSHEPEALGHGA